MTEITKLVESDCFALILAAGTGSRMRLPASLPPKPLLPVAGRPFLSWLIEWLLSNRLRIALGIGHRASEFREFVSNYGYDSRGVVIVEEPSRLDTGGLLLYAMSVLNCRSIIVMNADTVVRWQPSKLLAAHRSSSFRVTQAVCRRSNQNVGAIAVAPDMRVVAHQESSPESARAVIAGASTYTSTGVYVLDRDAVTNLPVSRCSLEHDLVPAFVDKGLVGACKVAGYTFDFGTPERYLALKSRVSLINAIYGYRETELKPNEN